VALRSGLKAQTHAVLAKEGVAVPMSDLFGAAGTRLLDKTKLGRSYAIRVSSLRGLIVALSEEIEMLEGEVEDFLAGEKGYEAIQAIPGVGRVLAAVLYAEIGDVARFSSPDKLCSWAGLTPIHRESDSKVYRGPITKQGSRLVRWAAVEAAQRHHGHLADTFTRIASRRDSTKIARVAVARKILTLAYYGLRDGEIRCLSAMAG
jgi:transposase